MDAHSKWTEAHIVSYTSATAAIDKLHSVFATHGLPQTIVSDNGPAFTSEEFQEFLRSNGIDHLRLAPNYHPSSNGLTERAVQTVKMGVKKLTGSLEVRLARFLFKYRVTPQATTGIAPAELLMGRRLRTHLDLLYPTVKERVRKRQRDQKGNCERHPRRVTFQPGDRVMVRNCAAKPSWLPGTVMECEGETAVKLRLDDGRIWRRHLDHVIASQASEETEKKGQAVPATLHPDSDPLAAPAERTPTGVVEPETPEQEPPEREEQGQELVEPRSQDTAQEGLRRSARSRHTPNRYH